MKLELAVDPIACDGHGLCADLLPELVSLDDWGFPVIARKSVPPELAGAARRAANACPTLALLLRWVEDTDRRVDRGRVRVSGGRAAT